MRLRTLISSALAVAVITGGIALLAPTASASTQDFSFDSMTSDYYLGRDAGGNATLRTVETLVAQFPDFDQNHGIERAIPLKYGEADLELQVKSVTDETGVSVPYSRNNTDGFAVLRIGSADAFVHGTTHYRIEYTQRNVVRSFDDTASDEFYWDVNGTGWSQPFDSVTATVHFRDGISSELTGNVACYQGYAGSTTPCSIVSSDGTITASANGLRAYQNMTIAIGFDPDTFVDPPLLKNSWIFALLPWLLLGITGIAFLIVLFLRTFVWRDAKGRGVIIPEYSPPEDAYPLLAAELLKRPSSGLPAQIVRFAVARVLAIRENPGSAKDLKYELELLADDEAIPHDEQWILTSLFGTIAVGQKQALNSTDRKLGDRLAARHTKAKAEVLKRGWREKPASKASKWLGWITFLTAAAAVTVFISAGINDVTQTGVGPAALICSLGWIFTISLAVPPFVMTDEGARVRDYLYGIRDYIALAEVDRFKFLQAPGTAERIDVNDESAIIKLYEKLLPYAMIFGLEKEWIGELGRHYEVTEDPDWYTGGSGFAQVAGFNSALASTRFATTSTSTSSSGSSWSSSGGSSSFGGSSGGGSSGGGGGGGGGGGW